MSTFERGKQFRADSDIVELPPNHHFVPHRAAHNDPHANFLRIRDQKLWAEHERRNAEVQSPQSPQEKNP
jgi:hypothetical protein